MLTWAEVRVVVVVVIIEVGSLPTKSSCSGETQAKMKEGERLQWQWRRWDGNIQQNSDNQPVFVTGSLFGELLVSRRLSWESILNERSYSNNLLLLLPLTTFIIHWLLSPHITHMLLS